MYVQCTCILVLYMYTCRRGQVCGRASLQDGQLHGSEMVRCMWSLHVGAGQTRNEVQRSVLKATSHGTSSPVPSHPTHSCGKERLVTIKAFIDPVKAISGWGFSARDYGIRDSGIICSPHADLHGDYIARGEPLFLSSVCEIDWTYNYALPCVQFQQSPLYTCIHMYMYIYTCTCTLQYCLNSPLPLSCPDHSYPITSGCQMVVHRMCMVEGIHSCDLWQKRKAGAESESEENEELVSVLHNAVLNFCQCYTMLC